MPLARSERAPQQAYRLGDAVWAIQFHIEVDADSVERWTGAVPEIVRARGADPAELVARARAYEPEYLADRARPDGPLPDRRAEPREPPGWLPSPPASAPLRVEPSGSVVVTGAESGAGTRSSCCTASAAPGSTGAGR